MGGVGGRVWVGGQLRTEVKGGTSCDTQAGVDENVLNCLTWVTAKLRHGHADACDRHDREEGVDNLANGPERVLGAASNCC